MCKENKLYVLSESLPLVKKSYKFYLIQERLINKTSIIDFAIKNALDLLVILNENYFYSGLFEFLEDSGVRCLFPKSNSLFLEKDKVQVRDMIHELCPNACSKLYEFPDVLSLKKYYPQIKLILVLPCKSHTKYWQYEDILLYEQIFKQANKVVYISEHYTKNCMLDRNIHLVKNSSYCISYLKRYTGGTAYTVAQAKRLGLTIYNIAKNI